MVLAGHVGKAEIKDYQVWTEARRLDEPHPPIVRLTDGIFVGLQRQPEKAPDLRLIVDDKYLRHLRRSASAGLSLRLEYRDAGATRLRQASAWRPENPGVEAGRESETRGAV